MAAPLLLVADDLSLIAAVKRTLAREGLECRLATSAADALIAYGHELPSLVLLQPDVESGRGAMLLEELHAHPEAGLLKVVLLGAALPGQDLPVEPVPIDARHLLQTVEAHRRGSPDALPSSVRKTLPPLGGDPEAGASARTTRPPEAGEGQAGATTEPSSVHRTWPPEEPPSTRRTWPPPEGEAPPGSSPSSTRRTWPPPEGEVPPGSSPSSTRRTWPPPEGEAPPGTSPSSTRRTWPPPEAPEGPVPSSRSSGRRARPPPEPEPARVPITSSPSSVATWPRGEGSTPAGSSASAVDTWPKGAAQLPEGLRDQDLSLLDTARVPGGALGPLPRVSPAPPEPRPPEFADTQRSGQPAAAASSGGTIRQWPALGTAPGEGLEAAPPEAPAPLEPTQVRRPPPAPVEEPPSGAGPAPRARRPKVKAPTGAAAPPAPPPAPTAPGATPPLASAAPTSPAPPSASTAGPASAAPTSAGGPATRKRVTTAPLFPSPEAEAHPATVPATASQLRRTPVPGQRANLPERRTPVPGRRTPVPERRTPVPGRRTPAPVEPTAAPFEATVPALDLSAPAAARSAPEGPAGDFAAAAPRLPAPEGQAVEAPAAQAAEAPAPAADSAPPAVDDAFFLAPPPDASGPASASPAEGAPGPGTPFPRGSTPSSVALADRLFGDLPALEDEVHRDVEAAALASLESALEAARPADEPAGLPTPPPPLPPRVQAALARAEAMAAGGRDQARARRQDQAARADLGELERSLASRRAEEAQAQLLAEQATRAALESQVQQLQEGRARLEAELAQERAAHAAAVEAARAHADVRITQRELTLSEEASSWQQRLDAAEAALAQAHAEAGELAAQLRQREERLQEVVRRRDEKVAELTRQREERLADLNRAQAEAISELTRRSDERVAELKRHLAEAEAAAEIARSEAVSSSDSVSRLEAEREAHDATRRALAEAEARGTQLQSETTLLEEARTEAEAARRAAQEAAERAEAARAAAAAQLAHLQGELATAREFVEEAGLQRQRLETELAALAATLTEARSALATQEQEKAGLRDELERAGARQAAAMKELVQVRDALDQARTRAEQAEASLALASQKLEEQDRRSSVTLALPGKRQVGVPRHGEVELEGLAELVAQLVLARADAALELGAVGGTRTLWLKGGQLVAATSTFPGEGLVERARQDGLIDGRQEGELRLVKSGTVREQLEALKVRRMIREVEAVPLVQRHAEHLALQALSEPHSQYRLVDDAPGPEVTLVTIPRPTLPLLAEALRRAVDPATLLERLGGSEAVPRATEAELDLRALGFSDRERRLLGRVDGEASVEALALESGMRAEAAFRALVVAKLLGLVVLAVPEGPRAPLDPELDARRLLAKYDQVVDADYFSILGLARGAGADEVRRAFERLREEFHPLRFSGHPDVGIQERAHQVFRFLEEAAQALEDDERRAEYARHLLD